MKMVLVVRADLKMRSGKVGAQCGHAVEAWVRHVGACKVDKIFDLVWAAEHGSKKVVLAVNSEADLLELRDRLKAAGIWTHLVQDLGHTEFHGVPTYTCLGVGVRPASDLDPILGPESEWYLEKRIRLY